MKVGSSLPILGGSLFLAVFLQGCDTRQIEPKKLPVIRNITDTSGRALRVSIIGIDHESVTFIRISDQKKYTIPLERLSQSDLRFLKDFHDDSAGSAEPAPEPDPPFIASRRRDIARLAAKRDQLQQDARSRKFTESARKGKSKEAQKLSEEIQKMHDAIRAYKR